MSGNEELFREYEEQLYWLIGLFWKVRGYDVRLEPEKLLKYINKEGNVSYARFVFSVKLKKDKHTLLSKIEEALAREKNRRKFGENLLLTAGLIAKVIEFHELDFKNLFFNLRIDGKEIDALVKAITKERKLERTIGFELKDNVLNKALQQALQRRYLFNYIYVVMNLRTATIMNWLLNSERDLLFNVVRAGIGIISYKDRVIVLPSKFRTVGLQEVEVNERC